MRRRRRRFDTMLAFEQQVWRVPAERRAGLWAWLEGRHRRRVFWVMDAVTGEWRQV